MFVYLIYMHDSIHVYMTCMYHLVCLRYMCNFQEQVHVEEALREAARARVNTCMYIPYIYVHSIYVYNLALHVYYIYT